MRNLSNPEVGGVHSVNVAGTSWNEAKHGGRGWELSDGLREVIIGSPPRGEGTDRAHTAVRRDLNAYLRS
ncbi:MAG: hypothetical protein ACEY26_00865 [Candidatus Hodgkinia cicadicola]